MRTAGLTVTAALLGLVAVGAQAPAARRRRSLRPRKPARREAGGAAAHARMAVLISRATGPTPRSRRSSGCGPTRRWC